MKKLKKKFRKNHKAKPKKEVPEKELGMWCDYYIGRLPFPIECQTNKSFPTSDIYKGDEIIPIYDRSMCVYCDRSVDFISWKTGIWDRIIDAIANGYDLRDIPSPTNNKI